MYNKNRYNKQRNHGDAMSSSKSEQAINYFIESSRIESFSFLPNRPALMLSHSEWTDYETDCFRLPVTGGWLCSISRVVKK